MPYRNKLECLSLSFTLIFAGKARAHQNKPLQSSTLMVGSQFCLQILYQGGSESKWQTLLLIMIWHKLRANFTNFHSIGPRCYGFHRLYYSHKAFQLIFLNIQTRSSYQARQDRQRLEDHDGVVLLRRRLTGLSEYRAVRRRRRRRRSRRLKSDRAVSFLLLLENSVKKPQTNLRTQCHLAKSQQNSAYQTPMQENNSLKLPQISNQLWC